MTQLLNFFNDFIFNTIPSFFSIFFSSVNVLGFEFSPLLLFSVGGLTTFIIWKLFQLLNPL